MSQKELKAEILKIINSTAVINPEAAKLMNEEISAIKHSGEKFNKETIHRLSELYMQLSRSDSDKAAAVKRALERTVILIKNENGISFKQRTEIKSGKYMLFVMLVGLIFLIYFIKVISS